MAMATGGKAGLSASMNLTPLVDVLLVLIIIFMVLPAPKQTGEEALIPRAPATPQPETPVRTLVVQLLSSPGPGSRPELRINGESVSWAGLRGRLQEVLKIRAERVVFVKADPAIDYEYVAEVIDIGRAAGADRVGLMPGDIESR